MQESAAFAGWWRPGCVYVFERLESPMNANEAIEKLRAALDRAYKSLASASMARTKDGEAAWLAMGDALAATATIDPPGEAVAWPPGTSECSMCDGKGIIYQCIICGSYESRTGTCGSDDPRALCNFAAQPAADHAKRAEREAFEAETAGFSHLRYRDDGPYRSRVVDDTWQGWQARGRQVERLLKIIAYAYQVAGAHCADERILDVLADPEAATDAEIEAMLPYEVGGQQAGAPEGWRAELDRAAWMLDSYSKHLYELAPIDIEVHPYIPSIEECADGLRAMLAAIPGEAK